MWPDLGAVRDGIIFNLLNMMGGILWTIDRIMLMIASVLHWFRVLLVGGGGQDNLLGILMTQLLQGNDLLKHLVYLGLMLSFTILSFTLIARPLIGKFQAVDFQRVILWLFIAVLIFSAGPGMVAGLEATRLGLQEQAHLLASTIQYRNEVGRFNNGVVPDTVGDFWLPGQSQGFVPHLFGANVGSDCPSGCNGLDAAAAFLGAEEGDITGARAESRNTGGYPAALYARYFTWREGNEEERAASLRNASEGVMRLLEGILPAFFSIIEALIFLLFGIAAMVLFISLPAAIPFAFFSLTEVIAASVLKAYLFLVLRTFVVATMMAFLVQMLIIFAERGTVLVFVSISALTMLLSFQFVHMAAQTVTGALNVIGSAVGSATGTSARQVDPFAMSGRVVGMAALAGAAVATGGGALAGAATLLHRQGGLRGGGLSAVGSAALHAARVRAGSALGRTPLRGLQRGYSAVHNYHGMSREHEYQLESARALLLDRDAEEATSILMEQRGVSPARKEWAAKKVRQWTSQEERRQRYRADMRKAGMSRLAYRGYSRPWKALNDAAANSSPTSPTGAGNEAPSTERPGVTSQGVNADEYALTPSGSGRDLADRNTGELRRFGDPIAGDVEAHPEVSRAGHEHGLVSTESAFREQISSRAAQDTSFEASSSLVPTSAIFNPGNPLLRAMASDAALLESRSVGVVRGYLVVYNGASIEEDASHDSYSLVPPGTDIMDLLGAGKHVQKSRKQPGSLVAWEPDRAALSRSLRSAAMWSGTDRHARRDSMAGVREVVDAAARGIPISRAFLKGQLGHLSRGEQERFLDMLQSGRISPVNAMKLLEAADAMAAGMEASGYPPELMEEFLSPDGYLDLSSPGVSSIMSLVAEGGGLPTSTTSGDADASSPNSSFETAGEMEDPGPLPADVALLISAGLGLKRAVPWTQVKSALVQAVVSYEDEPVRAVQEAIGAPSLRTSTAPINRFVRSSRAIGLPAEDVSAILDVAASARDIGGIVAGASAKDPAARHKRWQAAGVPRGMLPSLERVHAHLLQHVDSNSPAGTSDHRALEHIQEILGTLLTEGVTIREDLDSVPIETYSSHPFTLGNSSSVADMRMDPPTPAIPSERPHSNARGKAGSGLPGERRRAKSSLRGIPSQPTAQQNAAVIDAVSPSIVTAADSGDVVRERSVGSDIIPDNQSQVELGGHDADQAK